MAPGATRVFSVFLLLLLCVTAAGQELLKASRINSRANRKNLPELGLPQRKDGEIDAVVRYRLLRWEGADSLESQPNWYMLTVWHGSPERPGAVVESCYGRTVELPQALAPFVEFCHEWAVEKPAGPLHVVYGPLRGGWFVAVCKKTHTGLGWKSLAFIVPPGGVDKNKSIYAYSDSVNLLEYFLGYDLFPKLPAHLQELVEEITAAELLCPYQESDPEILEDPERELDFDWEQDYREAYG